MEELFQLTGNDYHEMSENEMIDISDKNVRIKSFNHLKNKNEYKKILSLIRKEDSNIYEVHPLNSDDILLKATKMHKLFVVDKEKYLHLNEIEKGSRCLMDTGNIIPVEIKETNTKSSILDIEVEDNENYFTNSLLSHNTTPGGLALKFYSSIRMEVRKSEYIKNKEVTIGFIANVKTVKNKVGIPFKKREMKVIYGKGLQIEEEFVDFALETGVMQRKGTWYFYGEERLGQGKESAIGTLNDNRDLKEKIEKETREAISKIDIGNMEPIIEETMPEELKEDE
jgi:hypothetical protein